MDARAGRAGSHLGDGGGAGRVRSFMDVGSGSGIRAIAAAKLWPAATGVALDIDPVAVEVAVGNLRRNQVGARVECVCARAEAIEGPFDLIVANIQAGVLRSLRGAITRRLAPGGRLILSGLLAGEAAAVGRDYARVTGLELVGIRETDTDARWAAAVLRRSESP